MTPSGMLTEFAIATPDSVPLGITSGPDGNLWFTQTGSNQIGRMTVSGALTEFSVPTAGSNPLDIVVGPDNNLWFTEAYADQIGRITPTGKVTEFATPSSATSPLGITAGADGNLWFIEQAGNRVGRMALTGSAIEFPLPQRGFPLEITSGPDGSLWFTEGAPRIGRITQAGTITEFAIPSGANGGGITAGSDGTLWFTEPDPGNRIGCITVTGKVTEFPPFQESSQPVALARDSHGNMWVTEYFGDRIARFHPPPTEGPTPAALSTATWTYPEQKTAAPTTTETIADTLPKTSHADDEGCCLSLKRDTHRRMSFAGVFSLVLLLCFRR